MPQIDTTRGNAGRSTPSARRKARRSAPKPYVMPPQRSDSAQRPGARPAPRTYSPNPSRAQGRPVPPMRSDAAQRRGAKPVQTVGRKRAARQNRRAAVQKRLIARHKFTGGPNPVMTMRRQERSAIAALANLRAQDPEKYKRNQRSGLENAVRDVAGAGDKAWRSAAKYASDKVTERQNDPKQMGLGDNDLTAKLTKEALDLVANAPTGAYQVAAAGFESARDTGRRNFKPTASNRAKKLWKDYKNTSAVPALVSGDFKEAAKRAKNAPVATALELSAAKAVAGRSAGAAGRAAGVKAAGTARPNLKLYTPEEGKGPEIARRYSKDLVNKGIQVAHERRVRKGGRALKVRGGGPRIVKVPGRDPHVASPERRASAINRRVDTRVFAQQRATERRTRDAAKQAKSGKRRQQLEDAGRVASIRQELRSRAAAVGPKERKDIRELLALSDRRLLDTYEAARRPAQRSPEAEDAATKVIERRARRGQPLGPQTKKALDAAVMKRIKADKAHAHTRGLINPEQQAVRNALGEYAGPERRSVPREGPLRREELEEFYADMAAKRQPRDPIPGFTPETPTPDQLPTIAARLAAERAAREHQALLADEFGVGAPVAQKGTAMRRAAAVNRLPEQLRGPEMLVPFRRGEKSWVVVPESVAKRLEAHKRVEESSIGPGSPLDRATSVFKDVVLTSASPSKWIGGNVADIGMRTLLEGITPMDIARGVGVNRRLRKEGLQGEQASASLTGGGLYTAAEALSPNVAKVSKLNVPRHVWRAWKQTIYTLEHGIEVLPQYGRMGKTFRQEGATRLAKTDAQQKRSLKQLLKLSDEQMDRFAHGIASDRALEARLQKQVEDVIGRWGKVSPGMRTALSIAPFAQWLGAATRYVLVTLPVHHPIQTGLMASIMQMTLEERKRLGLSYLAPEEDQAPDYQMGMLPLKVGQNKYGPVVEGVRTSRMTSLGTAAELPWGIPEFVFPQFSGAFNAWRGQSFTGEPLVYPEDFPEDQRGLPMSKADRLPVGLGAQIETMVPFASAARRAFLEQGRPADPSSTILTPRLRKKFNYETKQYEDVPAPGVAAGLLEWGGPYVGPPFAPLPRIYTKGAGRDIERSQQTMKQLEEWNARRKNAPEETAPLWGDKTADPNKEPEGAPLWGPSAPKPKAKPKTAKPSETDPLW